MEKKKSRSKSKGKNKKNDVDIDVFDIDNIVNYASETSRVKRKTIQKKINLRETK